MAVLWEVITDEQGRVFLRNSYNNEEIWQVRERDEYGSLTDIDLIEHANFLNNAYQQASTMRFSEITLPYTPISYVIIEPPFETPVESNDVLSWLSLAVIGLALIVLTVGIKFRKLTNRRT